MVGDNANPHGNAKGKPGKDDFGGAAGNDFMVGDNYSRGGRRHGRQPNEALPAPTR